MTTALKPSSKTSAGPLDRLSDALSADMAAVNATILDRMQSDISLIPELASHLIAAGGKRIRPLLTLASAALFGYQGTRQHKLAACVEFIHTATLLHDDVVDESTQRRGKASANALFGNEAAVLVGDFLFSRSFQLMTEDGSLEVLKILSDASAIIAEGEVMQLTTANDLSTTTDTYLRVIGAKTAALFAAACEVGAIVAERSPAEVAAMRNYGQYLGIAFQISDDVLDYGAGGVKMGKNVGDDFREGKMTLPVIHALAKADSSEKEFWARTMQTPEKQTDADLTTAIDILHRHGSLDAALKMADDFVARGLESLQQLPAHVLRDDLADLIRFAARRDH